PGDLPHPSADPGRLERELLSRFRALRTRSAGVRASALRVGIWGHKIRLAEREKRAWHSRRGAGGPAVSLDPEARLSGRPSNGPGCHGLSARCSSRKKSAFVSSDLARVAEQRI